MLLSLGLLWHGFHDFVREGDGERILRYWKFLCVVENQQINITMRRKQLISCSSTTFFLRGKEPSSYGAAASTREEVLVAKFHAILSWSTLIGVSRILFTSWVLM